MAARLVSSKSETRYASDASCRAITAEDWKRRSVCPQQVGQFTHQKQDQTTEGRGRGGTHLEVLRDFTDETLEGELADEELRRLLVPTDLTKSDGTRPETVRLFHTTSCSLQCGREYCWVLKREMRKTYGGGLARLRLGSELLTRGLATSGLASGLLSAGHCW